MYRPLVLAAHALNYALGGYIPWPYWVLSIGYFALYHALAASGTGIERAAQVRPLLANSRPNPRPLSTISNSSRCR